MLPGGEGEGRAAAGKAGAADFPERAHVTGDGASAAQGKGILQRLACPTVCRAGFAGGGTTLARSTERHTLASDSDPRLRLGSV